MNFYIYTIFTCHNLPQDRKRPCGRRKEDERMTTEKTLRGTTYIVESVVSDSAKETVYDKIKKMIENEAKEIVTEEITGKAS